MSAPLATTGLRGLTARDRTVPVPAALVDLVPNGSLQRGSMVACSGHGGLALALALAGAVAQEEAWVGVAGLPALGIRAAGELGVALDRLVLVGEPGGGFDDRQRGDVLATMIDGFDVVVLGGPALRLRAGTARTLQARAHTRGAVVVAVGAPGAFTPDLRIAGQAGADAWSGLGHGYGVALDRRLEVEVHGRRVPRPRRASVWLPDRAGALGAFAPSLAGDPPAHDAVEAGVVELRRTG